MLLVRSTFTVMSNSWKQAQVFLSSTVKTRRNDSHFTANRIQLQPLIILNRAQREKEKKIKAFQGFIETFFYTFNLIKKVKTGM